MVMDDDVLRLLEFSKVKGILANYAVTSRGKRMAEALRPMDGAGAVRHALEETSELARALSEGLNLALSPVEDVSGAAERARAGGGPLEPQVLWRIAECLDVANRVGNSLRRLASSYPALAALGHTVPQCQDLVARIQEAVDGAGMVKDNASPELREIRRRIRSLRKRIEDALRRLIENPNVRPHLQYPNPTMCRDRYVLPVKRPVAVDASGCRRQREHRNCR
jgi:DNA mismatch repair protein MutS2